MLVPETLEQYLVQFLNENKGKDYPDNFNEIKNATEVISEHYFPQQDELDDKDSYISKLEDETDTITNSASDIISDIQDNIEELEEELKGTFEDGIPTSIQNIIKEMKHNCDNWCY